MNKIKELFLKYKEIIMYLIMGVATTAVNWVVYGISVSAISAGSSLSVSLNNMFNTNLKADVINIFLANALSWLIAVIFAYVTNKIFVFESYSWKPSFVVKEFVLFVSARVATGVIEIFGVPLLADLGLDQYKGMLSKIVISVLVVILNYVFSKLFVFKDNKNKEESASATK